jgi:hypothetical protein
MENPSAPPDFHFDYEKTIEIFKLLADIRFKLLAFVPTIVGAAIALIGDNKTPGVMIGVGILGLSATIGVLLYELRNSELYNQAIHRAKYLEGLQRFPVSVRTIPLPAKAAAAETSTSPAVEGTADGGSPTATMSEPAAPTDPSAAPIDDKEERWPENGGVFSERRRGGYDFLGGIPIKHDVGLGFV